MSKNKDNITYNYHFYCPVERQEYLYKELKHRFPTLDFNHKNNTIFLNFIWDPNNVFMSEENMVQRYYFELKLHELCKKACIDDIKDYVMQLEKISSLPFEISDTEEAIINGFCDGQQYQAFISVMVNNEVLKDEQIQILISGPCEYGQFIQKMMLSKEIRCFEVKYNISNLNSNYTINGHRVNKIVLKSCLNEESYMELKNILMILFMLTSMIDHR